MSQKIIIVGAASTIAEAVARQLAVKGVDFFLVARDATKLEAVSCDLYARGARQVSSFVMDARDTHLIPEMLDAAGQALGTFDLALVAHGTLPDQTRSETHLAYAVGEFRSNAESAITCLLGLAQRFEAQGKGTIAVIGSVAGDRGRSSNYLYGSAKAAIEAFASGLRVRLFKTGVHLLLIKPGFVLTAMTAELKLPALLTASPERVAKDICRAVDRRADVLYTPWFWGVIMWAVRRIPSSLFKRMRL